MGYQSSNKQLVPATEALVFLVVCLTENWKLAIAYFLIKSLNGKEKANLVREALIRLDFNNIRITSVTCDGPTVNFSMLRELGCDIDNSGNDKTYFTDPNNDGERVFAILDVCHMLKLIRNFFGEFECFYDNENLLVEWKYIKKLHEIQVSENFLAGTKLRKCHMEWRKQKMKVRLAAQTLSSSVADAIEYLKEDLKLPEFQGAGPTIRFLRIVNRLFDILNSRCPVARGFKAPLRKNNEMIWKPFLESAIIYLMTLKYLRGNVLINTPRKTAFVGFIITIKSVIGMFNEYVEPKRLEYLLTYKFSQDHIELFFCSIRVKNGWNNNPNAMQMESTYKKLLFHSQVKGIGGNCDAIDATTILSLHSNTKSKRNHHNFGIDFSIAKKYNVDIIPFSDHDYDMNYSPTITDFSEHVVSYISGYVIKMIQKQIICPEYLGAIEDSSKTKDRNNYLLERKDKGGLRWPSQGLFTICLKCEIYIRRLLAVTDNKLPREEEYSVTIANTVAQIYYNKNVFPQLENHYFDYEFATNHVFLLIRTICFCYIKIRFYNLSKTQTESVEGSKIRQLLNKLILFNNQ